MLVNRATDNEKDVATVIFQTELNNLTSHY